MTFTICIILTPVSVGVAVLPQGNLDVLHLLGNGREHSLFQTVELVEAAPCSHLAQTHKDTTHGLKEKRFINLNDQYEKQTCSFKKKMVRTMIAVYLEIERFVTVEDQDKATQLVAESFH